MKLVILAVGRGRATPEQKLATEWLARLPQGGELIEVESKLPAGDARRTDEGQRLLRYCPDNIPLVACDPRGRDTSSEAMAKLLARWRDAGMASACFAIGGADGRADGGAIGRAYARRRRRVTAARRARRRPSRRRTPPPRAQRESQRRGASTNSP